ncbi:MAG: hypothetical protein WKG06_19400 [Segetibacter sp.]
MKFLYLLITIIAVCPAQAQVIKQPLSVRYAGLGAYSKKFSDIFSATSNQASLAQLKAGGFGVYGERRFLLEELNGYAAVVAVPTTSGVFGFEGDYFGSNAFNENELGILYARKITRLIDIGAKFNYYAVRIPGYGSASAVNFEAGVIFHFTDKLHMGIHVYNPAGSNLGKTSQEKLASVYRSGIGYEASELVFISAEVVKQEGRQIVVNAGLQYNLHKNVFIRTGISTLTDNSYVSVGLTVKFCKN